MSAQQLELAVLYAYNPPGAGEEAAAVKAQVRRDQVQQQQGWELCYTVSNLLLLCWLC